MMTPGHGEEQLIRAYLLGRLAAEERDAVGRRLLEDVAFFDRVQEQEYDLIDAAARGELDAADTASLTEMLRISSQENRMAFANALARVSGRRSRLAWWRYGAVAAGVLLAFGSCWLAWDNYLLRGRLAATPPQQERRVAAVYPLFLAEGVTRGSSAVQSFRIPGGAEIVELQLDLGGGAGGTYSVVLRTLPGVTLAMQRAVGAPLRVPVPAALLRPGSYEVEVATEGDGGRRPVAFYYFKTE